MDAILAKVIAEKRQEAKKAEKKQINCWMSSPQTLEGNVTQLTITNKELVGLNDEFKDKENENDLEAEDKRSKKTMQEC
ncbi:MAG: hypothetical protein IPK55_15225 [Streptococcus sp.]|nr:hypothetical protein [Streptococcus sp.]